MFRMLLEACPVPAGTQCYPMFRMLLGASYYTACGQLQW